MKEKSIAKNSLFNITYNILNVIFPLITSMYASHILMAEGIGKVAYAQNISSYFMTLAALGIPSYGIREIAKARNSSKMTDQLFSELFIVNGASTVLFTAIYFILIFSVDSFLNDIVLYAIFGVLVFSNFINVDWFYQGKEEYGYITARSFFIKMLSLISLFIFVKTKEDYIAYALISCLAACGNYLFNIIHIRKHTSFVFKNIKVMRHLKTVLILSVTVILSTIYSKIDITMLGIMTNDAVVGYYSNAFKIVSIVITGVIAVTTVFLPRLSYYYTHSKDEFYKLINIGMEIIAFLSFPVFAGLFIMAPVLIPLFFGKSFANAVLPVQIMSILIFVKGFGDLVCYQAVIATGNESKRVVASLAAAIINIIFNFFLIPFLGANGAAVASVLSEFAVNIILYIYIRKIIKIKINIKSISTIIISTLLMSVVVLGLNQLKTNELIRCMMCIMIGAVVYLLINYLLKNEISIILTKKIKSFIPNLSRKDN